MSPWSRESEARSLLRASGVYQHQKQAAYDAIVEEKHRREEVEEITCPFCERPRKFTVVWQWETESYDLRPEWCCNGLPKGAKIPTVGGSFATSVTSDSQRLEQLEAENRQIRDELAKLESQRIESND